MRHLSSFINFSTTRTLSTHLPPVLQNFGYTATHTQWPTLFACNYYLSTHLLSLSGTHQPLFASNFITKRPHTSGNIRPQSQSSLVFDSAKFIIPGPSKKNNGDDVAFCTAWHLAVADGVGGWGFSGIDPGEYPRELLNRILGLLQTGDEIPLKTPLPVDILYEAYSKTQAIGSTTCCLVFLDGQNMKILSANLGDSGFIVYRPSENKIVYRSKFQCHDFNFPLQLGTGSMDAPNDAEQMHLPVQVDDWIILGTDGLWDNLYEYQIIKLVTSSPNSNVAAQSIAKMAYTLANDRNWESPFSSREKKYLGIENRALGGKPDDISVVVARIRQSFYHIGNE